MSSIEKGCKYGELTALEFSHRRNGKAYWLFQCSCGNKKVLEVSNVKSGNTSSCGCLYKKTKMREKVYKNNSNLEHLLEIGVVKKNNKTGVNGVYYDKARNKYAVQVMYRGKKYSLGRYHTIEEAKIAREIADLNIKNGTFEIK